MFPFEDVILLILLYHNAPVTALKALLSHSDEDIYIFNSDLVQYDSCFNNYQQAMIYPNPASFYIDNVFRMHQLAKTYWQTPYISSQC